MMQVIIEDKRLTGIFPKFGSNLSAGIDLHACIDEQIQIIPGDAQMISAGIKLDMSKSQSILIGREVDYVTFGMIVPRSSWGRKGLALANTVGIIDADYQGTILMAVKNTSKGDLTINPLDRICQIVFIDSVRIPMEFVSSFSNETERGNGGFGSTGDN